MSPLHLLSWRAHDAHHGSERTRCDGVQAVLLDLAERKTPSSDAHRAIEHLESCDTCEAELASTALVLTALRRLADEVDGAVPPEGSWTELSARLTGPAPRRIRVGNVAGALAGLSLVVALALPPILGRTYTEPSGAADGARTPGSAIHNVPAVERRPLTGGGLAFDPSDLVPDGGVGVPLYPDNIKPAPGGGSGAQD